MYKKDFTIFLADDDSDDLEFFESALHEVDSTVKLHCFANGKLLCNYLAANVNNPPDILFLDINMPVKNGFKCLEAIKESKKFSDICIIIYSTSRSKRDVLKSYDLGANGFIQKTHSFTILKEILANIVNTDWNDPCGKLEELDFILKPSSEKSV